MRGLRATLRLAALVAAWGAVGAHADPVTELASSPAQRCLFPAVDDRVKPPYPAELYEAKIGASVAAEFEFRGPDQEPRVSVADGTRREFERAVRDYARQLRVPCMGAKDGPVKLRQTFDFVPNDGRKVAWTTPIDEANPGRDALLKCIVRPSPEEVVYPQSMLRAQREASVIARARYFAQDQPPSWEVLYDGGDRAFGNAVGHYLDLLRMPCVGSEAINENITFNFRLDSGGGNFKRRVLKDLPLSTFLGVVKPIKAGSVFFDTNTMKCPFDVRLVFKQPFEPNKIQELEEDVPARHAFLDWLGQREINLDRKHAGEFLEQQMTIHIPCATIDL
jgi:hypothetical protein